jgi:carbonic anhydrase/acetyltransferase-like protein (isoleucine patch superfamily)
VPYERYEGPPTLVDRCRGVLERATGELVRWGWKEAVRLGAIGPGTRAGRRFGHFGDGSVICFPPIAIVNEHYIHIGAGTLLGPLITLSAGILPGQEMVTDPVVRIGDRCLIGKGSGIVGHLSIEIGDDVWTGHNVYITDQNHGYEDRDLPISQQSQPEEPVVVGDGAWLGHGTVVLPGSQIGRNVVVAAASVVTGELPDRCVAAGAPARPIRRYVEGEGWIKV